MPKPRANGSPATTRRKEFVWLHFDLANSACERWMRGRLGLPDAFFDTLNEGSHSTRIEHQEGALFAVINDVMFNFELTPSEIATLWVYTHQKLLVTARLKPLRSVDSLRESVRRGEVFRSPAELLAHLLRDQADSARAYRAAHERRGRRHRGSLSFDARRRDAHRSRRRCGACS